MKKVTREQLVELLAAGAPDDAMWVMDESGATRIVEDVTDEQLIEIRARDSWPVYLIRTGNAENFIKLHGLDGAVKLLNFMFSLNPEPDSTIVRAAAITGRFLNRRRRQEQQ
ncbi:hypothetical protein ACJEDT_13125 [Rhodococcoides fascians]|uniref:hypothetical protein n=1 Tax=Rhodococcoides fascians TaxID=1828 RepID=UPI003899D495